MLAQYTIGGVDGASSRPWQAVTGGGSVHKSVELLSRSVIEGPRPEWLETSLLKGSVRSGPQEDSAILPHSGAMVSRPSPALRLLRHRSGQETGANNK